MNDNYDDLYKSSSTIIKLYWQETPTSARPISSTNSLKMEIKIQRTSRLQSEYSFPPKWLDSAMGSASKLKSGTQVQTYLS